MSNPLSRRKVLGIAGAGALLGGAGLLRNAEGAVGEGVAGSLPAAMGRSQDPAPQLPPVGELVSAFDFREGARETLPAEVFSSVEGGDRESFDRISFRPRMNISAVDMDLSVELFGQTLHTPLIVAPFSDHGAFHPEAELATLRGAAQSFAPMIVSRHSTLPFEAIAAEVEGPLWFSVYKDDPEGIAAAGNAMAGGADALFLTLRASYSPQGGESRPGEPIDWGRVERFTDTWEGSLILKGVETPEEAEQAIDLGVSGIVLSTHGEALAPHPLDRLSPVVEIVGGRVPILLDGSIRRGTDVLKALILGARGVLVARPVAWGLATYGSEGVATVLRLIQNEMARSMAMLGAPTLADLSLNHIRRHSRATE